MGRGYAGQQAGGDNGGGRFDGATFRVEWQAVAGATEYSLNVLADSVKVAAVTGTEALEYELTPEDAAAPGGRGAR